MNVTEMLQIADHLVFSQTGKHLDNLQQEVIKGVWQGESYQTIADELHHSESRIRDIGYKLWEILSNALGEDINKCNFRSTLERIYFNSPQFITIKSIEDCQNFRFFSCPLQAINNEQKTHSNGKDPSCDLQQVDTTQQIPYCNLQQAPKITRCYGRENELSLLSQWLENPNINIIAVLGVTGIGKSTLVRDFLDTNTQPFDIILWKNLKLSQSVESIITELLTETQANNNGNIASNSLNKFLNLLTKKRCLIILDHLEEIFAHQNFAGVYSPENQDYQKLFSLITEHQNQSKLILISKEKSPEMQCLDEEQYPIKCLELSGIYGEKILNNVGIKDDDNWLDLINLYEGNLLFLKSIITLIKANYDGQVAEFLKEHSSAVLNVQMKSHFQEKFNRLHPIEQQIVLHLSKLEQPISREELKQSLNLASGDFNNGLQSLQQRYLLKRIKHDKVLFQLSPVFGEYLKILDIP